MSSQHSIYLDNNATTPVDPRIAQRMLELQLSGVANPASQHAPGRHWLNLLEESKFRLLECLDCSPAAQVVLTSGGTEANNLAIRGFGAEGSVVVAATEHPSILEPALSRGSDRCRILPVDNSGQCDLDLLEQWLSRAPATGTSSISLVSVMLGNNETGIIGDLPGICQLCQRYGVAVHCDAVQAIGKIPLSMRQLGLSAMSITAHKLHGPMGIGALILQPRLTLQPLLLGGGQQLGLRPGTEPVIPAIALADAVQFGLAAVQAGELSRVGLLRDQFEAKLNELGHVVIIGKAAPRLPHVSNVAFLGLDRQALHMALDLAGIACSTGSACASGSSRPSPVLTAMKLSESTVSSSLRFSFSRYTATEEFDLAAEKIGGVVRKLRSRVPNS